MHDKIIPSNFSWLILLIISEIFSPLGKFVPSDIWAPIKYGLLNSLILSIAILNSLTLLKTSK
mgnify:FL=1